MKVSGEFNERLESMRVEQNTCEDELRRRDAAIDTLESGVRVLRQKVDTCKRTCSARGHPCTLLRGQIAEQDATVVLLKGELRSQAEAMGALNAMVSYKQTALENLVAQLKAQLRAQDLLHAELDEKDRLIQTQYRTIALLRRVDDQEDFLLRAKDVALRILQNTVYSMVNNIAACKDGAIRGLQQELRNLKDRMGPTEATVKNLKLALANTKALDSFHLKGMSIFN